MRSFDERTQIEYLIDNLNQLVRLHYYLIASYQAVQSKAVDSRIAGICARHITQNRANIDSLRQLIKANCGRVQGEAGAKSAPGEPLLPDNPKDINLVRLILVSEQDCIVEYLRNLQQLIKVSGMEPILRKNRMDAHARVERLEIALEAAEA